MQLYHEIYLNSRGTVVCDQCKFKISFVIYLASNLTLSSFYSYLLSIQEKVAFIISILLTNFIFTWEATKSVVLYLKKVIRKIIYNVLWTVNKDLRKTNNKNFQIFTKETGINTKPHESSFWLYTVAEI